MNKGFVAILSISLLLAACGQSDQNKTSSGTSDSNASAATQPTGGDTAAAASAPSGNLTPAAQKALELIGASNCTTCHRLSEATSGPSIGPAYDQVAARYSKATDTTVDRLVKKILNGGSGNWGTIPMTSHPALQAADVKTMVQYILSLKK